MKIKIGTRGSKLALLQTNSIKELIEKNNPNVECEIIVIKTKGDIDLKKPIHKVGKGIFVKEIEEALFNKDIDLAIHSMKDMPSEITEGLVFLDPPNAEDARDAIVLNKKIQILSELNNKTLGTGSLRRILQLETMLPGVKFTSVRGNIQTRMSKINDVSLDGVVLAMAGLKRCGYEERASYIFSTDEIVPAVCQGILAVEAREDDMEIKKVCESFRDEKTKIRMNIERAFQTTLDAGCHSPMGAYAEVDLKTEIVTIKGCYGVVDKGILVRKSIITDINSGVVAAKKLALDLKEVCNDK